MAALLFLFVGIALAARDRDPDLRWLPRDTRRAVVAAADREGLPVSDLIDAAIQRYLLDESVGTR